MANVMGVIGDPIGFIKNWFVVVFAAMIVGDQLNINAKISSFLDSVSGGRL